MFTPNTGLYLYKFWFNRRRKGKICLSELPKPDLSKCIDDFAKKNADAGVEEDITRRWLVTQFDKQKDGARIFLDYGRSGFGSRLIDGKSRKLNYDRKTSDVEVVPLLSRLWFPTKGQYGIWAFQSFGQFSCNGLVLESFKNFARDRWPDYVFNALPLVPSYLESYKTAPVTAVTLKKKAPGDAAVAQTNVGGAENVLIDVRISSERGSRLGKLQDLLPRFSGDKAKGRSFGGQEYDYAHATIDIEGRKRTVSLYGPGRGTGLIDLDDDVKKIGGHPVPETFFAVTDKLIEGAVKEMGFE